jgi:uncharacterized protein (DUF1810 family)
MASDGGAPESPEQKDGARNKEPISPDDQPAGSDTQASGSSSTTESSSHDDPPKRPNSPKQAGGPRAQKSDESSESSDERAPARDQRPADDAHFDLQRFRDAQESCYSEAEREMRAGRKRTHWIWFIFPQILIEGTWVSPNHRRYAIRSLAEAAAYLADPVLGGRLRSITEIVLTHADKPIGDIMGSALDATKFKSSMTLFSLVDPEGSVFDRALGSFFGGKKCQITMDRMKPDAAAGKQTAASKPQNPRAPAADGRRGPSRTCCCSVM